MGRPLLLLALGLPVVAGGGQAQVSPLARTTRAFDLLDNGDFREPAGGSAPELSRRVPWWRLEGGAAVERPAEGSGWLVTPPGTSADQPIAAYGPLAGELLVRGRMEGVGWLVLHDGAGGEAIFPVDGGDGGRTFEFRGVDAEGLLGRPLQPRLVLELRGGARGPARWTDLEAWVSLPCPDPATLASEARSRLAWIIDRWLEHGRLAGSGFVHHPAFDAVTGELLSEPMPGGLFPLFSFLLDALEHGEVESWRTALEAFLDDYLVRGLHPATGLPVRWDPVRRSGVEDGWVHVAADLAFLLDLAERGGEARRGPALEAARRLGEAVLRFGVQPDGNVAAVYRPGDGAIHLGAPPIRRLDLPAQLARLGARLGEERFTDAARNALAVLEYTHFWPGTWRGIDPGFDDDYGHYGDRAMTMLAHHPKDPAFRSLVESGWRHYDLLWRDALRYGGTVAADQVRCWMLLGRYAELEPAIRPVLTDRLRAAVRAHFKSQQYRSGAWGDVTFVGFDPKTGIRVGDLPGTPANLVQGIAALRDPRLGLDDDELRAMAATLLLSTDEHYRRPHGYLMGQHELAGANRAGGGIRLGAGLVALLREW